MPKAVPIPAPDDDDPNQMLKPLEVMRILQIGRPTADRLVKTGQIPGIIVSGSEKQRWRVRRSVLDAWIKKTEKKGGSHGLAIKPSPAGKRNKPRKEEK